MCALSPRGLPSFTRQTDQIDHDLYHLGPNLSRKPVLDHAHCTAPTRKHELDHTDHTDHTDQEPIRPEGSRS